MASNSLSFLRSKANVEKSAAIQIAKFKFVQKAKNSDFSEFKLTINFFFIAILLAESLYLSLLHRNGIGLKLFSAGLTLWFSVFKLS